MIRDIDSERRTHEVGHSPSADPAREPRIRHAAPERTPEHPRFRERLGRGGLYRVSSDERQTLRDIGCFRTVTVEALGRYRYNGDRACARQDLRSLVGQGLLQRRTIWTGRPQGRLAVVALTRRGKELLDRYAPEDNGQRIYSGIVKPAEVAHDTAIYRMYHAEAKRIQKAGGSIRRVVLDYELKQKVYSPLAKAKALPPLEYARRQSEIAAQNGLKVVGGHIPLPDLRIEYKTREGASASVDLELATEHYRGSQLRAKAEAGFRMYAASECVGRLSAALDEPQIAVDIFSL